MSNAEFRAERTGEVGCDNLARGAQHTLSTRKAIQSRFIRTSRENPM